MEPFSFQMHRPQPGTDPDDTPMEVPPLDPVPEQDPIPHQNPVATSFQMKQ